MVPPFGFAASQFSSENTCYLKFVISFSYSSPLYLASTVNFSLSKDRMGPEG